MRKPWESISDNRELCLDESRRLIAGAKATIAATRTVVQESRLRIEESRSLCAQVTALIDRAWGADFAKAPPTNI
jgi:hypothetical protein